MNIFKRLFGRKKEQEVTPLKVERVGLEWRRKQAKKAYTAKVALTYEGKPIRQFEVNVNAWNKNNAAYKINEELGLKLLSVVQNKKQK